MCMCMRILFVVSAMLWSWLVGRAIAFGPTIRSVCWSPNMHASTWYRLTPNPYNIPYQYFTYIAFVFAGLAVPSLFIDDNLIHMLTVLRLVSEHAYIPLFTAHVHSERLLTAWPIANAIVTVGCLFVLWNQTSYWNVLAIPTTIIVACLHVWLCIIQIHLLRQGDITRHERSYEERQPRLV